MKHLGQTRSSYQRDHALLTPDTFVRTPLPGMEHAMAMVHTGPAMGAAFSQYTAEMEAGGILGPTREQRFVYVIEGEVAVKFDSNTHHLKQGGYAYLPAGCLHRISATVPSRLAVIEKKYLAIDNVLPPEPLIGDEASVISQPLMGDEALEVRLLLPQDIAFDFAVNTMTYQPGATLPMVEIHVMEHGMFMLEGEGIYRLGDAWYPVGEGDFIWMGPFCPQWFGALGKKPARYLIYKDCNRHPIA